jgi:uncharacterized lipoprotein YddW (UPF0748 family)
MEACVHEGEAFVASTGTLAEEGALHVCEQRDARKGVWSPREKGELPARLQLNCHALENPTILDADINMDRNAFPASRERMLLSRRQWLTLTLLSTASMLNSARVRSQTVSEVFENRAIFDESLFWITKDGAERVCQRITQAGFNVFVPNVWHGSGVSWPSQLAPWDDRRMEVFGKRPPGFDPLENLIRTAARYHIEVHPWFTVGLRQRDFFPEFYDDGTPEGFFDVHRQAFRDFICNLIQECLSQYPVHGIHLDYVRTGGICSSPSCEESYRLATGRVLSVDRISARLSDQPREAIEQWQLPVVESLVRRVSEEARRLNHNTVVSLAGFPGNVALFAQGQDAVKWADDGLVDVVYDMQYEATLPVERIAGVRARMKRPEALVVLCGNYQTEGVNHTVVPRNAALVSELLEQSRALTKGNGLALYLYSMLNDAQIETLRRTTFRVPARPGWSRAGARTLPAPQNLRVK